MTADGSERFGSWAINPVLWADAHSHRSPARCTTNETTVVAGVAPNELTSASDRDPWVGTPHHKHVRARLEPLAPLAPAATNDEGAAA